MLKGIIQPCTKLITFQSVMDIHTYIETVAKINTPLILMPQTKVLSNEN